MTTLVINYKALVEQSISEELPKRLMAAKLADRAKLSENERAFRWHRVRTEAQYLSDIASKLAKEIDNGLD